MRIALDAMGGDHAPEIAIVGARDALARNAKIERLHLVGDEKTMRLRK